MDALILFEACLGGLRNHIPRRPHDRERDDLIQSGNVFIYQETVSGIRRWTDGCNWSPSRILGNYLIYRELDRAFPPGEKKKAMKKKAGTRGGVSKDIRASSHSNGDSYSSMSSPNPAAQSEIDRTLIGSLVDSYAFKEDGLIKKTISIQYNEITHHMVSYYRMSDVKNGLLKQVTDDPLFNGIYPRADLTNTGVFRNPIDNEEVHYRKVAFPEREDGWAGMDPCYAYQHNPMQQQNPYAQMMVHQQQLAHHHHHHHHHQQSGHQPPAYSASGWPVAQLPGPMAYSHHEIARMGASQMQPTSQVGPPPMGASQIQPLQLPPHHHPALPASHHEYSQEARHSYDMNAAHMRPMQTTTHAHSLGGYRAEDGEYGRRTSTQYGQLPAASAGSDMGSLHPFSNHGDQMGELTGPPHNWADDDYMVKGEGEDDRHLMQ
ncbi:Gti1/Pac2 family-domain-containing protein [Lasiosphaeris hirsuta]|uniref:Gti1/Pac2 family-domain-containing protein n=1 Tax=Lasiosphaeris hirsuta TaxID=260670 RepID=A0AA40A8K5_9PEZI|nr:Gti1/Pac2 family-domain-containing protein [Lasiosphaeris hirsuta]